MNKEWSSNFNPFNSMKILLWSDWLEKFAREEYPPPPSVDIDPSNRCDYSCVFCNAYDMMQESHADLSENHLLKLSDFFRDWGVKSNCVAGGGEALMNPATPAYLERNHTNDIQNGVITNGSILTNEIIHILARTCRWVGFSMDAATPDTYAKIKGIKNSDFFWKVIENIRKLTKEIQSTGSKCDVAYKYLIHPINANEIYDAAVLARSIGVKDFHMRPVGWDNLSKTKGTQLSFDSVLDIVDNQIEASMQLETNYFKVYGIRHKFNSNFTKKMNFSRCWTIPLIPTFGADGNVHCCFDIRGRQDLIMCRHDPDPNEVLKFWNSEKHKELIRRIDINKCPRCTFGVYNEAVEKIFIKDDMCRKFP